MEHHTTIRGRFGSLLVPSLLSAVLAVALWETLSAVPRRVEAQISPKTSPLDAVKDRRDVLRELQKTNRKLDALTEFLRSGKMRVVAEVELKQPPPSPRAQP